ncbi:coiled-coil domain-containing protein 18 isoform X1 [Hydra vulgaris]|uniref:coiled-coil domain-containing protein 18 isoform X1 n=1 Tax=Hydra vulgaris TaxID=6087 RepID=UPI001F5F0984|nr:coiled-coil domain-containing protein 18 isoform X1 [Hydra vulgaris]
MFTSEKFEDLNSINECYTECDTLNVPTSNYTDILMMHYETMKSNVLEVAEELRMRRILDKENEERINTLIQENFEIKRSKDEEITELLKSNNGLKQELQNVYQEFEKKAKVHEEEMAAQSISISSSSKGINVLKDEILTLQLAKYGLEKKVKDQEHELNTERRSKIELGNKIKEIRTLDEDIKVQFSSVKKRLDYLADLVEKTEIMFHRLDEVNQHNKCLIENYHSSTHAVQFGLNASIPKLELFKTILEKGVESVDMVKKECFAKQQLENEVLYTQLEKELNSAREDKTFLINSLSESNRLLAVAEERLADISLWKVTFQTQFDELHKENLNLNMMIKLNEVQMDDLRTVTSSNETEINNLKSIINSKEEHINGLKLSLSSKEDYVNDLMRQTVDLNQKLEMYAKEIQLEMQFKDSAVNHIELASVQRISQVVQNHFEQLTNSHITKDNHVEQQTNNQIAKDNHSEQLTNNHIAKDNHSEQLTNNQIAKDNHSE